MPRFETSTRWQLRIYELRRLIIAISAFGKGDGRDLRKLVDRSDQWRIRVGDWRVILTLVGDLALIDGIDNRRDAY